MSDFEKNRMFFTIALITSSLTIYPILKDFETYAYNPIISIKAFYWIFNLTIGVSIYLYAVSFIGETTSLKRTKKIANLLYRFAIFLPILYFLYYCVCFLINYYYVYGLYDYGSSSVGFLTEDNLFNFLQFIPLLILMFIVGIIGSDIADDYKNIVDSFKIKEKE